MRRRRTRAKNPAFSFFWPVAGGLLFGMIFGRTRKMRTDLSPSSRHEVPNIWLTSLGRPSEVARQAKRPLAVCLVFERDNAVRHKAEYLAAKVREAGGAAMLVCGTSQDSVCREFYNFVPEVEVLLYDRLGRLSTWYCLSSKGLLACGCIDHLVTNVQKWIKENRQ